MSRSRSPEHRFSSSGSAGDPPATSAPPDASADPAAVVRAFNTWAFKREQPSCLPGLERVARCAVERGSPLPFVLYWGKGPRDRVAGPERECLSFLESMAQKIDAAHAPGARYHLVFTDTHALLNGHEPSACDTYFGEVLAAAPRRCCGHRLSDLVAGIDAGDVPPVEPAPTLLAALVSSAAKWHRGGLAPEAAARAYHQMNMLERDAIARAFPDTIFVTFNDSRFRTLFPSELPVFYMYSLRKGVAVKPWFLPASDTPESAVPSDEAA